jgi:hypothetical protein
MCQLCKGVMVRNIRTRCIACVFLASLSSAWVTVQIGKTTEEWLNVEMEVIV